MTKHTHSTWGGSTPERIAELHPECSACHPTWDTAELQRDFTVVGFLAPFVVVIRKADNVKGTLEFTHNPRVYFGFTEA